MDCPNLTTDVGHLEAFAILEPYAEEARQLFLDSGLSLIRSTRFEVADVHDSPRHFAACREDGGLILVDPLMVELPEPTVVAILAHEFGHAADFLYPGQFLLSETGLTVRDPSAASDRNRVRWVKAWEGRDDYVVEATADAIASHVFGSPIGYAGPCSLQTFRGGVPRPKTLR